MADAVQLHDAPRCKRGLPEFPKFIRRTVRVQYTRARHWKALWLCRCGKEFESLVSNVTRRHTLSCGCVLDAGRKRSFPKHGHFVGDKPSPTYKSWQAMIARCTNPKHPAFLQYGGRGITICERWQSSFPFFLEDVGERPLGRTLDRINTNGDYVPGNVQWSTRTEQTANRRITVTVNVDGVAMPLTKLHTESGSTIPYGAVWQRLRRGWSYQRALIAPLQTRK